MFFLLAFACCRRCKSDGSPCRYQAGNRCECFGVEGCNEGDSDDGEQVSHVVEVFVLIGFGFVLVSCNGRAQLASANLGNIMGGRNHWVLFSSGIEIFFFRRSLRAGQGVQCLCLYEWKRGCVPPGAGGAGVAWVRKIV